MSEPKPLAGPEALRLIACCALSLAPFFFFQPFSFTALSLLLLAWRAHLSFKRQLAPPRGLLVLIGLLGMALAGFEFKTILGREVGLALLSLLLPLKLLETRNTRDARVALLLCCFLLTGQFLLSQALPMALLVLACTLAILTATTSLQRPGLSLREAFSSSLGLLLAGIPLMLVFFLLFPRLDSPLWRLPLDMKTARTGLSDTMSPGSISALVQSGEIAFRASFEGPLPPASQRYWRALVLSHFDGQRWRAGTPPQGTLPETSPRASLHTYTLTLEAQDQAWMPVLDYLVGDTADGRYLQDFSLRANFPITSRKRYTLQADPQARVGALEDSLRLRLDLFLPATSNPRTQALGHSFAKSGRPAAERVALGIRAMREAGLAYTLNPPPLGRHSADEFLFGTRRGFCEHFASSFVILMRAAGVPARVVAGYQGGELNPIDGTLVVRQSDAHAWAEVWLGERGWVRVDPTATSAPKRIDEGIAQALPEGDFLPLSLRGNRPWLMQLRHRWEALNNGWNQWVLGYDARRQLALLQKIGWPEADWPRVVGLLAACATAWMAWLGFAALPRKTRPTPLDRAWQGFCARLAKAGLARKPWEGPSAFAQRASLAFPAQAQEIRQIAEEYAMLRYGPLAPRAPDIARFRQRASSFKPRQER